MRLLIVTPFFPRAKVHHAGGKFVYELIKALSRRHKVHLLSRIEPGEIKYVSEMEEFCEDIRIFRFGTPDRSNPLRTLFITMSYLRLALMANRLIRDHIFDIIQVEHSETGLLMKKTAHSVMILDAHDVISKPAGRRHLAARGALQRCIGWLKWQIIKKMEVHITGKFDHVFTRSAMDRDIILDLCPDVKVSVVPHLVMSPAPADNITKEENSILFVGAMGRDVNIQAALFICKKILPLVREKIDNVKIYIAGHNPPDEVRVLADESAHVVVTGFVHDLAFYYRRAAIFVSPIFIGGGIIAKNIEAMSYGLPVVTTAIGNEGIKAVPGQDLITAETAGEFAGAVISLLKDHNRMQLIGQNARKYFENNFDMDSIINKVERIYGELCPAGIDSHS
ncbi:MAG: glycosyltransferase [Nitrospirae bacterium]|nr:glycosyltransferase [Nitrospirota bacterium]